MRFDMSRFSFLATALAGALLVSACVTINIYFPAAAAEKAADKLLDDIWELKGDVNVQTTPADTPTAPAAPATTGEAK
jgi:lipopolysaccharide export LptBFGC system permease protein LptF